MNALTDIKTPYRIEEIGTDRASIMRRISVACDVQRVASAIWSWGAGPRPMRGEHDLSATISYHHNPRGLSDERILAVHDYVCSYVPGGASARVKDFSTDDMRALMSACRAAAESDEARFRKQYERVSA